MDYQTLQGNLRPLLRWWWLILGAVALAAISSTVFIRLRPPVYISEGTVAVGTTLQESNPDTSQIALSHLLAQTYARLGQQDSVRAATAQALGMSWLPEYAIRAVPDSQMIRVTVTDSEAVRAQAVAQELINQLVRLSPEGTERQQRSSFIQEQLTKLEETIQQTEVEIAQKQDELSAALSARQIRLIEDQLAALQAKLATFQSTYVGMLSNTEQRAVNSLIVLDPPMLPQDPIRSNWYLIVIAASLAGFALASVGAYTIEALDNRLTNVEQVNRTTGLKTLGIVPVVSADKNGSHLVMLSAPSSPSAESFRVLRTSLMFASVDFPLSTIHITSPSPGEGKSMVSSNLAIAFAQSGKRVVLVDADLRKPSLHRNFGLVNNVGVTSALLDDMTNLGSMLHSTDLPELRVMTSGPLPPNPSELVSSIRMQKLLTHLGALCDLIIIDSSPVTVVSESAVLASRADGVLLVLSAESSRRERAKSAVNILHHAQARMLGVCLNKVVGNLHGYYYSYNTSYGGNYLQSRETMRRIQSSSPEPHGPRKVPWRKERSPEPIVMPFMPEE